MDGSVVIFYRIGMWNCGWRYVCFFLLEKSIGSILELYVEEEV